MKVLQRRLENGNILLDATATVREVGQAFDRAQILFANKMGLRPEGRKTPAQVAQEKLGIKDLDAIVENEALEYLWPYAVEQRNLVPAFPPKPVPASAFRRGMEFKFQVEVCPKPKYELSSYDPITLEAPELEVDLSRVDRVLEDLASRYTEFVSDESISRPVAKGDTIRLKMVTTDKEGNPVPNLTFDSRPYTAGENYMPDGFDENILGASKGETVSFTFELPRFGADGRPATEEVDCSVTILDFQRAKEPEIDDEWVRKFMPAYSSRQELAEAIAAETAAEQTREYRTKLQNLAAEAIASRFEGKIPDGAYISMRESLMESIKASVSGQGKKWEDYLAEIGGQEQLNIMLLLEARQTLAQGYALDAVFRHFKLHIVDQDIDDMCRSMNPDNPAAVRKAMEEGGRSFALRESAERYKAGMYLVDHATIIAPGAAGEEPDAPADSDEASDAE